MADVYTTREVAEITGLGWSTVKRKCKEGAIPAFKEKGVYYILKGDLNDIEVRPRGWHEANLLKSELDKINEELSFATATYGNPSLNRIVTFDPLDMGCDNMGMDNAYAQEYFNKHKVITYEKEENTIMSRLKQMVTRLTRKQNTSSIDSSLPTTTSPTSRFTRVSSSSKDMSMQKVSNDDRGITSLTSSCDTKTAVKR